MAKRFTDTDKWKKAFIKKLSPELKLLWFYILDDCDISGLWQVDIEVASIRIGMNIKTEDAIKEFGENIIIIGDGDKWFIPSFLEFQYGNQLSKTNNIYKSIEKILTRYNLYQYLNIKITESGTTISSFRNRISNEIREKVFINDNYLCQYCQEPKPINELVVDHFIPLNKGGDNSAHNLICACTRCNLHKSDILPHIFLEKDFDFLNPSSKINSLKGGINSLEAPSKNFEGGKDKDKDKDKDEDMVMVMDKEKAKGKIVTVKKSDHLFSESPFFDLENFKSQFKGTQYEHANFEYYHEVINNWSVSNGNKKKDWVATAKNWMASDMTKGKFIDKNFKPNATTKTYQTRTSHISSEQLHESLIKRFGGRDNWTGSQSNV